LNGRQIVLLVRKDLLRRLRNPLSTILVLAFPLIFAGILSLAFGPGGTKAPKVRLLIDDQDGGLVGAFISQTFARPETAQYFEVEKAGPDALKRLEKGDFSALLRIPKGLTQALLDGRAVQLELVRNPSQSILPEVAEQIAQVLADALSSAAYSLRGPLDELRPLINSNQGPSDQSVATVSVTINQWIRGSGKYIFPPAITLKAVQLEKPGTESAGGSSPSPMASVFLFVLPGLAVFALFTLGDMVMRDLLGEGTRGTLRRVLAGPVRPGTLVIAKSLTACVVAVGGLLILAVIAGLVARHGVDFVAFALLSLALVACVTGLASTIYGLARSERQGSTVGSALYLILAFSGGAFLPLDNLPRALRAISPASLFYWGTQGYQKLVIGGGLPDVLLHIGILAGSGLVLLTLGGMLLRRRVLRGAA
jgi:ABC-type multidrug transport system permease subunit